MKQFFRYLFFGLTIFSLSFNSVKSETIENITEDIAKKITKILTNNNHQVNITLLEQKIINLYSKNKNVQKDTTDQIKNSIAIEVRLKLASTSKERILEKIRHYQIKTKILAYTNLNNILTQILLNTEKETDISDENGNKETIIWINPTCVFVILSITGTITYYYYLHSQTPEEIFEQISNLWKFIKSFRGIIPIKE